MVKLRGADAEPAWLTAHLVERDQPGITVEQAVLHGLGGHRAAQLLQPHRRFAAACQCRGEHLQRRSQFRLCGLGFGERAGQDGGQPEVVAAVDVDVAAQCGHRFG